MKIKLFNFFIIVALRFNSVLSIASKFEINHAAKFTESSQSRTQVNLVKRGLKILYVAPNTFRSHFDLNQCQIRILLEQEWVHKIDLLILEESTKCRQKDDLQTGGKLVVRYVNPYASKGYEPSCTTNNEEWKRREPPKKYLKNGPNTQQTLFMELFENHLELVKSLEQEKYDLGVAELFDYMAFPLFWLIGIQNVVATSSMALESIYYEYLDFLPKITQTRNIPEIMSTAYDDHKMYGLFDDFAANHRAKVEFMEEVYLKMNNKLAEPFKTHYGKNSLPQFKYLFHNIRYIFLNNQPFLDFPMPHLPQKIVHFGGITLHGQPLLPLIDPAVDHEEFKAISAAEHKNGLIVISFGSIVRMVKMPDSVFNNFVDLFQRNQNYEFIWKFETKAKYPQRRLRLERNHPNVHSKPWIKQKALLANPHTRLFISHCGMNSILEAVQFGVPILCIPFFADQFYNAEALAKRDTALVVNKDNMEELSAKVHLALNPKYKEKMMMLKKQLKEAKPVEIFLQKIKEFLK